MTTDLVTRSTEPATHSELENMAGSEKAFSLMTRLYNVIDHQFTDALRILAQEFGAFGGALWRVRDQDKDSQLHIVGQWFGNESVPAFHDLPLKGCFTGQAILKNKPLYFADVNETRDIKKFPLCKKWLANNGITSLSTIPIRFKDQARGAITLYWRKAGRNSTGTPHPLFRGIAGVIPDLYQSAIDKAGLNLVKSANKILQKGRLSDDGMDMEQVIREMGDLVHRTLHPLITSIYLKDIHQENVANLHYSSYPRKEQAKTLGYNGGEGLITWVLDNKKPVIIPDLTNFYDRYVYWQAQYPGIYWYEKEKMDEVIQNKTGEPSPKRPMSLVVLPILDNDRCLGAISCFANLRPPYLYSNRERILLEVIAKQLGDFWASYLRRVHRDKETLAAKGLLEVFDALNTVTQKQLSSGRPEIEPILKEALRRVRDVVSGADILDVRLRDFIENELFFAATFGSAWQEGTTKQITARRQMRFPIDEKNPKSTGAKVVVYKRTIIEKSDERDFVNFKNTQAIISAPINDGEQIHGVLDLRTTKTEGFTEADIRMAQIMGQLLGLCLSAINATNAQRTEKAEIKQFYQDFMHQLRSPVFQTDLRIKRLLSGKSKDNQQELKRLASLSRKSTGVVNSYRLFLDLSKGEPLYPKKVHVTGPDLREELNTLVEDYGRMAPPKRNISIHLDQDSLNEAQLRTLKYDKKLVEHALGNVLDNAVKYSYDNTGIRVWGTWSSNRFSICTSNKGMRLNPSEIPWVTKRGWRSDESEIFRREGMGIGLWIVEQIMTAMGGRLIIQPTNGAGNTIVKLEFPIKTPRS